MAGAGYLLFTAGQVLTAAQVNTYLNQQSVMVFATTAARDSALTSVKSEGMVTYQLDNNDLDIYNGSTFSTLVAPAHGALTTWTPAIVQSGSVTATVTRATYHRMGRSIFYDYILTVTGTGTAFTDFTVSLPITAASSNVATVIGQYTLSDVSLPQQWTGAAVPSSTTTMKLRADTFGATNISYQGNTALAAGDIISCEGRYEAAADA